MRDIKIGAALVLLGIFVAPVLFIAETLGRIAPAAVGLAAASLARPRLRSGVVGFAESHAASSIFR